MKLAFDLNEAAESVGVGKSTIVTAVRDGKLRVRAINSTVIVLRSDLEKWLDGLPDYERKTNK